MVLHTVGTSTINQDHLHKYSHRESDLDDPALGLSSQVMLDCVKLTATTGELFWAASFFLKGYDCLSTSKTQKKAVETSKIEPITSRLVQKVSFYKAPRFLFPRDDRTVGTTGKDL